jgi:hypothetical protein
MEKKPSTVGIFHPNDSQKKAEKFEMQMKLQNGKNRKKGFNL